MISKKSIGNVISIILIMFGAFVLFSADASRFVIAGILLIALGIWGLVK